MITVYYADKEAKVLERIKIFMWLLFLCPRGYHQDKNAYGEQGNFCMWCGKQTHSNPFSDYVVTLRDGTAIQIRAVNKAHARNLVIYAGDMRINGHTGQPAGILKVHPSNIATIESLLDEKS